MKEQSKNAPKKLTFEEKRNIIKASSDLMFKRYYEAYERLSKR